MTQKIVVATGNPGKLREIERALKGEPFNIVSQKTLGVDDAIEDGLSFVENALIKARHAALATGLPAIADDSGLEVECLDGQPGIYSARYAGEGSTDTQNNQKLLETLGHRLKEHPVARFQCVIVFMRHAEDPVPLICQGSWEGYIADNIEGQQGFGYDPLFYVPDQQCTAAQLSLELKNQISHRGKALNQFIQLLKDSPVSFPK
ncbi:MAG: RdgB/HAM1 family non-canonical purine NTP pyrophosphatase [Pseudomonadales bacterium]|nr:RdgB/HAM1 family non-canonical purine NTP pyrophosphatase [Pseudomonadales bacterium]